ncbi:MAG: hypothetical protein ACOC2W_02150 [bacterium]
MNIKLKKIYKLLKEKDFLDQRQIIMIEGEKQPFTDMLYNIQHYLDDDNYHSTEKSRIILGKTIYHDIFYQNGENSIDFFLTKNEIMKIVQQHDTGDSSFYYNGVIDISDNRLTNENIIKTLQWKTQGIDKKTLDIIKKILV